jgi:NitT/TauT family transport system ATP-binding protein
MAGRVTVTAEPSVAPTEIGLDLRRGSSRDDGHQATSARWALEFRQVTKTFPDGTQALMPVTFGVAPGELVSIVGPSGCGKSTLLRLASGLAPPSSGAILVDSNHLGYVFQDASLLPWRTVRRNVELFAQLRGVKRAERRQLAEKAIATVGLTGSEDKYPRALSGGMKMRTSLARSLTIGPDVLLFDEPLASLDEITRQRIGEEILDLFGKHRFAALFVTHSVSEAVFLSSRVVVMSSQPGRVTSQIEVPFPYPRPGSLRYTPEFAQLSGVVSEALRESHS